MGDIKSLKTYSNGFSYQEQSLPNSKDEGLTVVDDGDFNYVADDTSAAQSKQII